MILTRTSLLRILDAVSRALALANAIALTLWLAPAAQAAQAVLQRGYDPGVSGATLTETILNTSNVGPNSFGLVFKLPVDDNIYAQPLYVPNVAIPNHGTHNVVYVATMSDTLYAFDADTAGSPLWKVSLASLVGATAVPFANFAFSDSKIIVGNLGILSTPVIDPSINIMYVVACTLENGTMAYRLHAIDITTGAEPYGPGVLISGYLAGSTFDARYQLQRISLVLSGNQVVLGFSAVEVEQAQIGDYAGWVMAYNERTLQQSGIFATVTTGSRGGGVWQSGRPPVVDSSGYVYLFTGNAYGGGYDGVNNFSESALKLDPSHSLKLVDWFTPDDWSTKDTNDKDLSGSGPLLIPGTSPSLLAGCGKDGILYVLDSTNLGKYNTTDAQIVQEQSITEGCHGGPVYWQRAAANGSPLLYNSGVPAVVKVYPFNGAKFAANPSAQGSIGAEGMLALSANGDQHGSGILWATVDGTSGVLHALNAENVSAPDLWNSGMNPARDGYGAFAKLVPPVVANGKVYVSTFSHQLAVYGLLESYTLSPTSLAFGNQATNVASAPMSATVTNTGANAVPITSIALSGANPGQFSQTNTCGSSVAARGSCTISVVFLPTSTGSSAATLSVNTGGGAGMKSVALSGTGYQPTAITNPKPSSGGGSFDGWSLVALLSVFAFRNARRNNRATLEQE